MFRMWGKLMKDNHLLRDTVICISDYSLSRTQMVFDSLDSICYEFNLEKARFTQDNFIESIDFDFLEIQVIEE